MSANRNAEPPEAGSGTPAVDANQSRRGARCDCCRDRHPRVTFSSACRVTSPSAPVPPRSGRSLGFGIGIAGTAETRRAPCLRAATLLAGRQSRLDSRRRSRGKTTTHSALGEEVAEGARLWRVRSRKRKRERRIFSSICDSSRDVVAAAHIRPYAVRWTPHLPSVASRDSAHSPPISLPHAGLDWTPDDLAGAYLHHCSTRTAVRLTKSLPLLLSSSALRTTHATRLLSVSSRAVFANPGGEPLAGSARGWEVDVVQRGFGRAAAAAIPE
ncbi:hypothetical protein B0H13DRAFT_2340484 [Mycena leptocephala]|nr:hypothetical protein B0H13DRAFT_2340484 [Mycena leptocephala]